MTKNVRVMLFPWPPAPAEVRELDLDLKTIQAHVQGDFECHTLANRCAVYCNAEGMYRFRSMAHDPYFFPYIGFDLPPPEQPDGIAVHTFNSMEELLATPRKLGGIEVWGPCMIVGPADGEGEETSVPEEAVALLQQAFRPR